VEKLQDDSDLAGSALSAESSSHRATIRRIRRQLKKADKLAKARCIFIETRIEDQLVKTLLDGGSEINCISRKLVRQLGLPRSVIHEEASALGRKLQTFGVHFLTVQIVDKNGYSRFFEESFLEVNMQEELLLGMPWFQLANPGVDWPAKTIEWRKDMSLLPTSRRVAVIDPEDFAKRALDKSSATYVLHMHLQEDDLEGMLKGSGAMLKGKGRKREQPASSDRTFLGEQAIEAFEALKQAFLTASVLRHFDPAEPLRVETDASDKAIGAILCQPDSEGHWHPIAYLSRKMIPAECNYEVHDKELLAIVESFKHWRHYLEGAEHEILVLTDHNNLKKFMQTTRLSPRQVRWAQELSRYNFRIDYRPGTKNPADGLSRLLVYEGQSE